MAKAKGQPTHIEDVDHQVVPTNGQSVTTEQQIRLEVAKFNFTEQRIAELKAAYGGLTIAGPEDKDGYRVVKDAFYDVRSRRTALEKKGLELRGGYTIITKAISAEEKRLIGLLSPLEEELEGKWCRIDQAKKAAEEAARAAEEEQFMSRVRALKNLGATSDEGWYTIGDTVSVDVATLRTMGEPQWLKFLTGAEKKAEELRLIAVVEKARLAQVAEEEARQRRELVEGQRKLAEQQAEYERQQAEVLRMRREARMMQVELAGLQLDKRTQTFVYDNAYNAVMCEAEPLLALDDTNFQKQMGILAEEIRNAKLRYQQHLKEKEEERLALEAKQKLIAEAMQGAGLTYNYMTKAFGFKNRFADLSYPMADLVPLSEENIHFNAKTWGELIATAKTEQQKQEQAEKAHAEQLRQSTLSDKQKFSEYLRALIAQPIPQFKTKKYVERCVKFSPRLANLINEFTDEQE